MNSYVNDTILFIATNFYLVFTNNFLATKHKDNSLPNINIYRPINNYEKLLSYGIVSFPINKDMTKISEYIKSKKHKRLSKDIFNLFMFQEVLYDNRLIEILDKTYNYNNYHLATYSTNTLSPQQGRQHWHVDYPYHNFKSYSNKKILGIQVFIVLDDMDEKNGATYYCPKSFIYETHPSDVGNEEISHFRFKKGDMVLMLASMWHSEGFNSSDSSRSLILANFVPNEVPAKDSFTTFKDTLLFIKKDDRIVFNK